MGRISLTGIGVYSMTKHAVISFNDALRQEVSEFGIKVISIEPGLIDTILFSTESQIKQLMRSWTETSDEVKEVYGSISKEKENINLVFGSNERTKPEVIVDDIIDAIVSRKPKSNYKAFQSYLKVLYALRTFFPSEFGDFVMDLYSKMGPLLAMLN